VRPVRGGTLAWAVLQFQDPVLRDWDGRHVLVKNLGSAWAGSPCWCWRLPWRLGILLSWRCDDLAVLGATVVS